MKVQIISNPADTAALLRFVNGRYDLPKVNRLTYVAGIVVCLAISALPIWSLVTWTPQSGDDRLALIIGAILMLGFACMFAEKAMSSYSFSADHIRRDSPLPFLRRSLATMHVHEGWLHYDRGFSLEVKEDGGRKLRIPLEARLRSDVAKLYPDVADDRELSVASSKVGMVIWVVVAALIIATVVLMIILLRSGLTSW